MKDIKIEFFNIQSHEHTQFSLHPGLNFILADDNNVGKSTIFKVILCAMQLPRVNSNEIDELIRGDCRQACAKFEYDSTKCVLWLFRESGKASRAFFEVTTVDGVTTRHLSAPASLQDALDIVLSEDGKVVNLNDADSVQLIVEDTPKNDEVLAKVLVDLKVDSIKANLIRLSQQIQQDYKMVHSKLEDVTHTLSTLHYNDSVDLFEGERLRLEAACRVLDSVGEVWNTLEDTGPLPEQEGVLRLRAAFDAYAALCNITLVEDPILDAVSDDLFIYIKHCLSILGKLEEAANALSARTPQLKQSQLDNARKAIQVLSCLNRSVFDLNVCESCTKTIARLDEERKAIRMKLASITTRVSCPVKGEVFYSDDQCIPCGN